MLSVKKEQKGSQVKKESRDHLAIELRVDDFGIDNKVIQTS